MRLVFDSGPLIALSRTCLLDVLDFLSLESYIPPAVYREVYTHPHTKRMYAWSATLIGRYIGKRIFVRTLSARENALVDHLDHLLNSVFYTRKGPLRILQRGELEAVVLARDMDKVLVVDERTMRLVVEDPEQLRARLSRKIHGWVKVDERRLEEARAFIRDIFMVRSADLVAYAYEKGYFHTYREPADALRSALYALKYSGSSVSEDEIEQFMRVL